jgi:hypothetical protein
MHYKLTSTSLPVSREKPDIRIYPTLLLLLLLPTLLNSTVTLSIGLGAMLRSRGFCNNDSIDIASHVLFSARPDLLMRIVISQSLQLMSCGSAAVYHRHAQLVRAQGTGNCALKEHAQVHQSS